MNKRLHFKSGVTLIEVIFYASLLTIVLTLTTSFLYQVANFKVSNQVVSGLFQNSQLAIKKITQDVRLAESVSSPVDENFIDTLVLETEEGTITYQVKDGVLRRNEVDLTDGKVEVDFETADRGFRRIGNSLQLKIRFRAKLKPFGQTAKEQDYQTTIYIGD